MKNTSKVGLLIVTLFCFQACATNSESSSQVDRPLVEREYRLKEDREAFDAVRTQEPEEVRSQNDELAFMDKLFENPLKNPNDIRSQFSRALNKKREKFNKDMNKRREVFVKKERKDREQATKDFEKQRQEFKLQKASREQTKEFHDDLDQKRKDFYASQKEKREDFEAQMRDDRKNFEDYTREKQNDFNARLKEFTEKQKQIKSAPAK